MSKKKNHKKSSTYSKNNNSNINKVNDIVSSSEDNIENIVTAESADTEENANIADDADTAVAENLDASSIEEIVIDEVNDDSVAVQNDISVDGQGGVQTEESVESEIEDDDDSFITDTQSIEEELAEMQAVAEELTKPVAEKKSNTAEKLKSIDWKEIKPYLVSAAKIVLPIAACLVVIIIIISLVTGGGSDGSENEESELVQLTDEPLLENAYDDVNELMNKFFAALADGDMETIKSLRDYNDETTLLTYEKRSEYIDEYLNVTCYTKPGLEENSYFVYVSYDVKVTGVETTAPGLNAFYVYTTEDGSLIIDGDMDDQVDAAFKLVTNQDDVVDLYNEIDVSYNEAIASDEELNTFMTELPTKVKTSVGEALALAQTQSESGTTEETQQSEETESTAETEEEQSQENQNKIVNEIVRTTATVNVRKSDSEEADKLGKAAEGTELTRTEDKINGWSKVIFEGEEAYIKSEYLEVVSSQEVEVTADDTSSDTSTDEAIGTVTANTNVNVRSSASQDSDKLGLAQATKSYELLEDLGEWYKINFNGSVGYVKAEYFDKQ